MKKLVVLVLALMLALSLVACDGKDKSDGGISVITPEASKTDSSPSDSSNSNNTPSDSSKSTLPTPQVSAMTNSKIYLDLEELETSTPPQMVDAVIMVPMKTIMEKIGYDVNWLPAEQKLEVWEPSRQHPTIIVTIGSTAAYYEKYSEELDDRLSYEAVLAAPPIMINDTLFAPLNFVSDAVGYTIDGSVDSEHIYLFSPEYMENQAGEGIGEDQPIKDENEIGEGIGVSQPLTQEEKDYVLSIRTESWLDLTQEKKEELISLMARWWDIVDGYVVEDFDSVLADLDHQMETYFRNSVDEGILPTACDIYGLDATKYIS